MSQEKKDIVVPRVFDAPIERVWKAWSEPEGVRQWWGQTVSCALARNWIFA